MAHLLGSQACLDSLTRDVTDIHTTAVDVMSRTGPVRFPSWKYPDKIACELDMSELLEYYCYSEDEDHCKLSHIILFELVIDRLVLLLQTLSQFSDQLLKSSSKEDRPGSGRFVGSAMSVGLVAKKFCNKLVHVQQALQQLQFESKTKNKTLSHMESTIHDLQDEIKMCKTVLDKKRGKKSAVKGSIQGHSGNKSSAKSPNETLYMRSPSSTPDLTLLVEDVDFAKTYQETSSQTYDTAFVPCEACSRTQQNLIDVGGMVMKLCESQGLPSSLAKQKKLLRKSIMAAADVSRWTSEQNQDLARINAHLDNLYAQINPLEEKLSRSQEMCKALEKQVSDFERRVLHEKSLALQHEESVKEEHYKIVQDKEFIIVSTNKANEELTRSKQVMQQMFSELNIKTVQYKEVNETLENENAKLLVDLEKESKEVSRLKDADADLEQLKGELDDMQLKLKETSLELGKTRAKNRSLEKHEKALHSKHDALLHRVGEFDEECENLRQKMMETEDDRDSLQEALENAEESMRKLEKKLESEQRLLEDVTSEKDHLREQVENLESRTNELEQQLQESEEKLKLVMDFPSLDTKSRGTQRADNEVTTNGEGEMNVVKDMEQQIMSNNIRIMSLEGQNEKLRKSITLLMATQEDASRKKAQVPVALWKSQELKGPQGSGYLDFINGKSDEVSENSKRPLPHKPYSSTWTEDLIQPRPPHKPRADSAKNRVTSASLKLSEKRQSLVLSSKLAASGRQAANRTIDRAAEWEHSSLYPTPDAGRVASPEGRVGGASSTDSRYTPVNMLVCSGCDKMYTTKKDLDIHKSFCYGRI